MKRNSSFVLALAALVLSAGCSKNPLSSSVDVSKGAKAGFPSNSYWQTPSAAGRLIRFDIGDGNGSDCLLSYDLVNNFFSITQVSGTTGTTIISDNQGIPMAGGSYFSLNEYAGDVTDNFNEIGGIHIIPYDANGTGHEDHLLLYIPGRGIWYLFNYAGDGKFNVQGSGTNGIGGYDLAGSTKTDKIIAYDYGSGYKNALICYRPGNGYAWVIENTASAGATPNWVAVVKGSSGIGGFDLKGTSDQIITEDYNPGYQDLVCYRPGYGYVWYLTHTPNSTNFTASYTSRSGLSANGYTSNFMDYQDRMFPSNVSGSTGSTANNTLFCYRPGTSGSSNVFAVSGNTVSGGGTYSGLSYTMPYNPYGSPYTYIGDHVLSFSGNGYGNSSLVFYSNGGGNQSQIYELNPQTSTYSQAY
ncbi:hypothetical protein [Dinghuibacter silviterrae]|uniref:Uncharacterized protein n=1 Tax=Dinghuibacter silviterrae TaxID=1539049 RepID=A0A4V3GKR0_9BACT|nr:hypothetical protein [Dinghuibacter silviterrae]TDW96542.1 hypothetical protein EDB95_4373 [Dinghuibacter silviterrae]